MGRAACPSGRRAFGLRQSSDDDTADAPRHPVAHGRIDPLRGAVVGTAFIGSFLALNQFLYSSWWSDVRTSFHVREDFKYALNLDKFGHVYGTVLTSFIAARSLEWAGLSRRTSVWYGAAIGTAFELYTEFQDGHSPLWGFDRYDAAADLLGGVIFVSQHEIPFLRNFDLKFSYYPSPLYGTTGTGTFLEKKQGFVDDFWGHTYWLSVKVNNFLPSSVEPYWPDVLALAIGVSTSNLFGGGQGEKEVLIGLDYDIASLPGESWFVKTLKEAANYIRFPAPAVRVTPSTIWYGLYYSQ